MQETPGSDFRVGKISRKRDRLPTPAFLGFPCGSAGKEFACNVGDLGSISGLGRSPGEGEGYPLQYSGLENSMDCIVHGVARSRTQLNNLHCTTEQKGENHLFVRPLWIPGLPWRRSCLVSSSRDIISVYAFVVCHTFLMAQLVKNLPAVWETWVRSLGWEDPLEKGKATHSSILAWRIPYTVWFMGLQRVGQNWATSSVASLASLATYKSDCFSQP